MRETPPEPLKKYLRVPSWYMRDSNWSPDFAVSAMNVEKFYRLEGGKEALDSPWGFFRVFTLGAGFDGSVHAIEYFNGSIYAAGSFSISGSTSVGPPNQRPRAVPAAANRITAVTSESSAAAFVNASTSIMPSPPTTTMRSGAIRSVDSRSITAVAP